MPLAGRHLLPREIAQLGRPHWQNAELVKMVATCLGESAGYVGAYHDNLAPAVAAASPTPHDGNWQILSRDCGLMQINIQARDVGGVIEKHLRTEDKDPDVALRVARDNVAAAYRLYEQPWDGRPIRRWQPWVAYTTGWATFPAWWTWHQVGGKPVGPWVQTGRYLQHAIAGVANYHLIVAKDMNLVEARDLAQGYAKSFRVDGEVIVSHSHIAQPVIAWRVVTEPTEPPSDGIGPRPVENNGV